MGRDKREFTEGVVASGLSEAGGGDVFPKTPLDTRFHHSLSSMTFAYAFFTPAIPYRFGGMTDFLWFELSRELGHDVPIYFWKSPAPLVAGCALPDGDNDWNHGLWATKRMYWDVLLDFVASSVFFDRVRGSAAGFGVQELQLQDTVAEPRRGVIFEPGGKAALPTFPVAAFGLNASDRRVAFDPLDVRVRLPRATSYPPTDDMIRFVDTINKGDVTARQAS